MKRRDLGLSAAAVLSTLAAWPSWAQGKPPQEGVDYLALDKRVPVESTGGKVEVIEFFWYGCPHCNAFEPRLEQWIKRSANDVVVKRVPVAFRDDFVPQQRLFYTLEALNRVDDLHAKVFYTIHVERQVLNRQETILQWAEKQGLDRAKFLEIYNSFAVQTKARRATQLQDAYKVSGVPALGIAGRFYTDGSLARNMDRALQVTDFLVAEVKRGR